MVAVDEDWPSTTHLCRVTAPVNNPNQSVYFENGFAGPFHGAFEIMIKNQSKSSIPDSTMYIACPRALIFYCLRG